MDENIKFKCDCAIAIIKKKEENRHEVVVNKKDEINRDKPKWHFGTMANLQPDYLEEKESEDK